MGGRALTIRTDVPAAELRRLARYEKDRAAAARMQAIAGALEGLSRAEAARLAGMERQALRDAVVRYNAEDLAGLHDRPRSGRPARLDGTQKPALKQVVLDGPDVEATGLSAWTLAELCREVEQRWGVSYHPSHMGKLMHQLGLSRQKARPSHPKADAAAREAFAKGGLQAALDGARAEHSDKRLTLWFMDEARFGQKGRVCHRWFTRGQRPPGLCDQRYSWTHLFAAVRPATGDSFALVLPEVSAIAMNEFLARFAATLAKDEHAVMVLDRAGWHTAKKLVIPGNLTLVWLPPYSPEINPVERVWLYLREKHWSHRLLDTSGAIVDALCQAWNALTAERLQTLTSYPYLEQVKI